jgi:hypothetical protein
MTSSRAIFVALALLGLAGCPNDEVRELKKTLGPFQYAGLDPQLSFTVQKHEFEAPKQPYAPPTLNYSITVKQNNSAFPLTKYGFNAKVEITDGTDNAVDEFFLIEQLENGVGAFSKIQDLYGARKRVPLQINSLKVRVTKYEWYPIREYAPFKPSNGPANN